MVRVTGVEPARLATREPKSRMSANSIIPAYGISMIAYENGEVKPGFEKTPPFSARETAAFSLIGRISQACSDQYKDRNSVL